MLSTFFDGSEAMVLRDKINKELSRKGYHLRVAYVNFSNEDLVFNFVESMHNWLGELPEVQTIIVDRIKDAQRIFN
jgi:hypothetical protein